MLPIARSLGPLLTVALVTVAFISAGCSSGPATQQETLPPSPPVYEPVASPPAQDEPAPPPEAPALRLPSSVLPIEYRAELTIDSSRDEFSGVIDIDVNVLERTDHLWLNATDITVKRASLAARGQTWELQRLATSNEDFLGLGLGFTLPPGKASLRIEYTGNVSDKDYSGIFKQKDNDRWYVYTQFEATSARRAFPCFDEPRFKVPWQITLHVNESDLAFANTPMVEEKAGPSATMKTYRFAQSKPMPSYLVAMAVGPFEIVDLGQIGRNQTPARILVPHGRTAEARYAAEATPVLLQMLEDYFDMPYPYAKLDSIAIPHFFGAMENPGLITYNAALILSPPDKETVRFKRGYASVGAHEIAHQWFGNLVTLDWWDDIWLNESFATWMAQKIVAQWKPEWRPEIYKLDQIRRAMYQDSLVSARQIRQPIVTKHDISSAFDSISYAKGSAVLSMFEGWIGEEPFRDGVRAYLKSHAWDTATADDFLAAISKVGQPGAAAAFQTFLNQPGIPQISADLVCERGKPPAVSLSQKRLLPIGSTGSTEKIWQIPVCIRYGKGTIKSEQCLLLTEQTTTVALDKAQACPDWLVANSNAAGYYRVAYSDAMLSKLLGSGARHASPAERLGVVDDLRALVETGALDMGKALSRVPALLKDKESHVITRAAGMLGSLDRNLVPERLQPNYRRFVLRMIGARARTMGWTAPRNEDDEARRLRSSLVTTAAAHGEDPVLLKQAVKLATTWLDQRTGIADDDLSTILSLAIKHGDDTLYDRFLKALESSKDRTERRSLIHAIATTTNPQRVQKNFEMILSDTLPMHESYALLQMPFHQPQTRQLAYDYIKSNFDVITAKLPRQGGAFLIGAMSAFCDEEHRKDVQSFFEPRADAINGGPNALKSALERIDLCIAFRAGQQTSVEKFLQRY
jgi:cytosol alanyl aminopeptidase